jgi:small subunit ribosomal protein S16
MGKKKQPFYRIVAIDSRVARDGKYLDNFGTYNPRTEPASIDINTERALYWLARGAQPSDTVKSLFRQRGILLQWHLKKNGLDDEKIGEELNKWEALQHERQKRQEALREQKKRERKAKKEEKEATPAPTEETEAGAEAASTSDAAPEAA